MGGWVLGVEALVHSLLTEPFRTATRWTPVMEEGRSRCFADIQDLAGCGNIG